MSEDEIARMVREAEENAEQDKALRSKIEAKNQLESYLYGLRSSVEDAFKDKLDETDKLSIETAIKEALAWLEDHQADEKEAFDEKRRDVEAVANPIIAKVYDAQGASASSSSGKADGNTSSPSADGNSGPTVEEVE